MVLTNVFGVIAGTNSIVSSAGNAVRGGGESLENNGGNRILVTNDLSGGAVLTFSTNPIQLSESATTGRTLTLAGSGATNINVAMNNGPTGTSGGGQFYL